MWPVLEDSAGDLVPGRYMKVTDHTVSYPSELAYCLIRSFIGDCRYITVQ